MKSGIVLCYSSTKKTYLLIEICLLLLLLFLTSVLNSQGMKKLHAMQYKKVKNHAKMNLTPPPPSQNSHAVRWHCSAESSFSYSLLLFLFYPASTKLQAGKLG